MKKAHFIGIGGIGVSALARYFLADGWTVSGSDISDSELLAALRSEGIDAKAGEDAAYLPDDTDYVVYSEAIITKPDLSVEENLLANAELRKARALGIENESYPRALARLFNAKKGIAVTGTHGKSTTTAMLGAILKNAPDGGSTLVGTLVPEFGNRNVHVDAESDWFAIEACEYKRGFLAYEPSVMVVTNIDLDHLDYYRDLEDYVSAFRELAARTGGPIVIPADDANSVEFAKTLPRVVTVYPDAYVDSANPHVRVPIPPMTLRVPGAHMLTDARLAYAAARLAGVPGDIAVAALESYSGSWRRGETVGKTAHGNLLLSDYGHHPNEIRPTLAAIKSAHPDRRLVVAFQPHQYSRTIELLDGFLESFDDADELVIPDVYFSRDKKEDVEAMPPERFVALLSKRYPRVVHGGGLDGTLAWLRQYDASHPDSSVILLLGAGTIDNLRFGLLR